MQEISSSLVDLCFSFDFGLIECSLTLGVTEHEKVIDQCLTDSCFSLKWSASIF